MSDAANRPGAAATRPLSHLAFHESFIAFSRFRYLKYAAALSIASFGLYCADRPFGSAYGGTWAGYVLGTVGALLIFWLTWFGYRKRNYAVIHNRLAAQLSAHIYLGLSLLVVATLHTGFHFGWNIHTLAYVLMCLVIASGAFGVFCYERYPRLMTENRAGMTMQQMLGRIATLDDELRHVAMPVDETTAGLVERATSTTQIGGSVLRQLSGSDAGCPTEAALAYVDTKAAEVGPEMEEPFLRLRVLLDEKAILLRRARRDISFKALMDVWLYLHVPMSLMLLAALVAHIVAVFFLW